MSFVAFPGCCDIWLVVNMLKADLKAAGIDYVDDSKELI